MLSCSGLYRVAVWFKALRAWTGSRHKGHMHGACLAGAVQKTAARQLNTKPYLDLKEPTFFGLLIMISLYKSLERLVIWG